MRGTASARTAAVASVLVVLVVADTCTLLDPVPVWLDVARSTFLTIGVSGGLAAVLLGRSVYRVVPAALIIAAGAVAEWLYVGWLAWYGGKCGSILIWIFMLNGILRMPAFWSAIVYETFGWIAAVLLASTVFAYAVAALRFRARFAALAASFVLLSIGVYVATTLQTGGYIANCPDF